MTGRMIAGALLVCAVGLGLALRARTATPAANGMGTAEMCGKSVDEMGEALGWGEFSQADAKSLSQAVRGGIGSTDSSVDATIDFLVGASDFVVQVEVVDVGQIRYNTPTGQLPSVAGRSPDVDSLRLYAPALLANHQVLQPADAAGRPCGFIAPVWLPNGVHDNVHKSLLASRLTPGLQGLAFLNSVVPEESLPWLSYLELNRNRQVNGQRQAVPVALVGAFFPIDGKNVIGYRGGAMPIDRFNALVAEAATSRQ